MSSEKMNAMPTNREFIDGAETSILVRGGDEVEGVVESFTTGVDGTILTLVVDGTPTAFEFVSGQWSKIEEEAAEEIKEAA